MILNKTELFRGYSLDRFNKICSILSVNKIKLNISIKLKIIFTLKNLLLMK